MYYYLHSHDYKYCKWSCLVHVYAMYYTVPQHGYQWYKGPNGWSPLSRHLWCRNPAMWRRSTDSQQPRVILSCIIVQTSDSRRGTAGPSLSIIAHNQQQFSDDTWSNIMTSSNFLFYSCGIKDWRGAIFAIIYLFHNVLTAVPTAGSLRYIRKSTTQRKLGLNRRSWTFGGYHSNNTSSVL